MSSKVFEDDDAADVQEALPTFVLNIFVVTRARDGGLHKRAGIAVEGTEELFGIPDVARACASLMGLICTLELSYPKKLKYTSTCTPKSRTDGNEGGYSELPVLQLFILNCIFSGSPMHVALLCGGFSFVSFKNTWRLLYFMPCKFRTKCILKELTVQECVCAHVIKKCPHFNSCAG